MVVIKNLEMDRGDNITYKETVKDKSGTLVSLVNALIIFSVKLSKSDKTYKIQLKNTLAGGSSSEIEDSDSINGECKIHIVPANTASLPGAKYVYDVQITLSNGKVYTVTKGRFTLNADVTR